MQVVLQGVSLHDNRAGYGAAVAARGNSSLEMDGALLQRNNASQDGEAVLVGDQAQVWHAACSTCTAMHHHAVHTTQEAGCCLCHRPV